MLPIQGTERYYALAGGALIYIGLAGVVERFRIVGTWHDAQPHVRADRPPASLASTLAAPPLGGRSTWTSGVTVVPVYVPSEEST